MSDDLVKRLRVMMEGDMRPSPLGKRAADRIEELEELLKAAIDDAKAAEAYAEQLENVLIRKKVKLAKAVEALERIEDDCAADYPPSHGAIKHDARITLTELKGQDDE